MSESRERKGLFGPYTEHVDDHGNKIGESRERDGLFGTYTEHVNDHGNKVSESRERDGLFGTYTEHVNDHGNKIGESRERDGLFGTYTEHVDDHGNKIGESREREGLFGPYTEHTHSGSFVTSSQEEEEEDSTSPVIAVWIFKAIFVVLAIALVFASWPIWLGMILLTTVLSVVLAFSLANGGWAAKLDERLGGRALMLAPGIPILIFGVLIYVVGFGGSGFVNKALLTAVLVASGIACWYVARRIFDFAVRRAARSA